MKDSVLQSRIQLKTKIRELSVEYKPGSQENIRTDLEVSNSKQAVIAIYALIDKTSHATCENLYALFLTSINAPIGYIHLSRGGVSSCNVDIRLLVQAALMCNARKVILIHNHPSGGLKFSQGDYETTKIIKEGLHLFEIKLLDHIVASFDKHLAMRDVLPKEEIEKYLS